MRAKMRIWAVIGFSRSCPCMPALCARAAEHVTVTAEASGTLTGLECSNVDCVFFAGNARGITTMASTAMFAEVAALAGDPARAGMLHALMDGRALTASELARVAGITPQTASGHLTRMTAAGLLGVEKQGRHRYHRLASPTVAQMMESIMQVASDQEFAGTPIRVGPRD